MFLKARKIKLFKKEVSLHNVANINRTKTRHLKLDPKNYIDPLKNLIKIYLKRSEIFFKAAVNIGKISF